MILSGVLYNAGGPVSLAKIIFTANKTSLNGVLKGAYKEFVTQEDGTYFLDLEPGYYYVAWYPSQGPLVRLGAVTADDVTMATLPAALSAEGQPVNPDIVTDEVQDALNQIQILRDETEGFATDAAASAASLNAADIVHAPLSGLANEAGTAYSRDVGTGATELPTNADLGDLAQIDTLSAAPVGDAELLQTSLGVVNVADRGVAGGDETSNLASQPYVDDGLGGKIDTGQVGFESVTTSTGTQTVAEALDERAAVSVTVASMVDNLDLQEGAVVKCVGYANIFDEGGNVFQIEQRTSTHEDGGAIIFLDNGLQAKAFFPGDRLNSFQWGAPTKTFYVSNTGSDSNLGTETHPFLTIGRAIEFLTQNGPNIAGGFEIEVSAGTYNEAVHLNNIYSELPISIKGPVAGHPNVPTVVISGLGIESGDAFKISNGSKLSLTDVRISGFTAGNAANNSGFSRCAFSNVHIDNTLTAVANLHNAFFSCQGGIWDGGNLAGGVGYRSFYGATHNLNQKSNDATTDALVVKNFERALLVNEGVQGHLDNVNILDCGKGLVNSRGAGACNTKDMKIDGCGIGVENLNTAWFNNGIVFGSISPNQAKVRSVGSSSEYALSLTENGKAEMMLDRAAIATHTGTTAPADLYSSFYVPEWVVSEGGHIGRLEIFGTCTLTAPCDISLLMDNGTQWLFAVATVPAGATDFSYESVIWHSAAATQRSMAKVVSNAGSDVHYRDRNGQADLSNTEFRLQARATLGDASDSVRFSTVLFSGTYAN